MTTPGKDAPEIPPAQTSSAAPSAVSSQMPVIAALFTHWTLWLPALGGALMLIYFWRIGYAPSLSFADLGTVLGALLLMCGASVLAIIVLWAWPFMVMGFWVAGLLLRGPPKPLPAHKEPMTDRARAIRERRTMRGKRSRLEDVPALRQGFAAGSLTSFVTAAVASGLFYATVIAAAHFFAPTRTSDAVLALLVIFGATEIGLILFIDRPVLRRHLRRFRRTGWQWALLFLMYMGSLPMLILPFLYAGETFLSQHWHSLLATLLLLSFLHWVWFVTWRVEKREIWLFRVGGLALVLLISGLPLRMIDLSVETVGLGMLRNVDLVLTARGCEIVHAAWPERACAPDHRGMTEAGAYRLERVDVLTRIGSHYYIAPAGGLDDKTLPRFTIPSEDVMSWVRMPEISIGETGK